MKVLDNKVLVRVENVNSTESGLYITADRKGEIVTGKVIEMGNNVPIELAESEIKFRTMDAIELEDNLFVVEQEYILVIL